VIKLHPDLVWKIRSQSADGNLQDLFAIKTAAGRLPDHVKLVMPETDISTYSFFGVADYCLTVRGTIGMEMACFGVPVLTAGTGRYAGLGFTVDSGTRREYIEKLMHIQEIPAMNAYSVELARRYMYALLRYRPWRLTSFEFVRRPPYFEYDPLDHNLEPRVSNWSEFTESKDIKKLVKWIESGAEDYWADTLDS